MEFLLGQNLEWILTEDFLASLLGVGPQGSRMGGAGIGGVMDVGHGQRGPTTDNDLLTIKDRTRWLFWQTVWPEQMDPERRRL